MDPNDNALIEAFRVAAQLPGITKEDVEPHIAALVELLKKEQQHSLAIMEKCHAYEREIYFKKYRQLLDMFFPWKDDRERRSTEGMTERQLRERLVGRLHEKYHHDRVKSNIMLLEQAISALKEIE